jgi:hypothetical protein
MSVRTRTLHPLRSEKRGDLTAWIFWIQGVEHEVISDNELPPIYQGGSFRSQKKQKAKEDVKRKSTQEAVGNCQ